VERPDAVLTTTPAPTRQTSPRQAQAPAAAEVVEAADSRVPAVEPTVAVGTVLSLAADTRLCINDATPGTRIAASVREVARGTDGAVVPMGASIVLAVASREGGELRLAAKAIDIDGISYPVQGAVVGAAPLDTARVDRKKRSAWGAVAGAAAGAVVGTAVGRDAKGAVIGATAGAAVGATAGAVTAPSSICLPAGAPLKLSLSAPLVLRAR
jgi:hypothetical protein